MLAVQSDFCGCLDFPFNISQDINNGFFGDLLPFGMSKCFFGMFFFAIWVLFECSCCQYSQVFKIVTFKGKIKVTAFANAWCASPFLRIYILLVYRHLIEIFYLQLICFLFCFAAKCQVSRYFDLKKQSKLSYFKTVSVAAQFLVVLSHMH